MLDRLAIQSSCSLSVHFTGGSFITSVCRDEVIHLLDEAIDLFKNEFNSVLRAATLSAEAIHTAVLTGSCYDVPGYEAVVQAVLPGARLVRSNDVSEMIRGVGTKLTLQQPVGSAGSVGPVGSVEPVGSIEPVGSVEPVEPVESETAGLRVLQARGETRLSTQALQLMKEEVRQLRSRHKKLDTSASSAVEQSEQSDQPAALTLPVSLQPAGDDIFAPTNPTVHCGRRAVLSHVDITTRSRSGAGGLEVEVKESKESKEVKEVKEPKEGKEPKEPKEPKEVKEKARAMKGKEVVDLLLQTPLNWRDMRRLAALVQSKTKEGKSSSGGDGAKEEKASRARTKEVKEVKTRQVIPHDENPDEADEPKRKAGARASRQPRKQRIAPEGKAVKRTEPSGEPADTDEPPQKTAKLEKVTTPPQPQPQPQPPSSPPPSPPSEQPVRPVRHVRQARQAKLAKAEKQEKNQREKKKPAEKAAKKEPFQLPKVPPCLFDFDARLGSLPSMYFTAPPTILPRPAAQRAWEDDLSAPMYYNSALHEPVTQKVDEPTRPQRYADGSVYTGHTVGNLRHGNGRLVYPDGSVYKGQFRENSRYGKGSLRSKKGELYFEGSFEYDYPKKGVLTLTNGARYEGQFSNGLPDGEGTLYGNGRDATWDGEWRLGVISGKGTFFFDNGDYYDGTMADGLRSGEGHVCTRRGRVLFNGRWEKDLQEGPGVQFLPDGYFLRLNFHKGVATGEATVLDPTEKEVGSGRFESGVYSGYGRFYMQDGTRYFGEVRRDKMEGKGEFYFDDCWHLKSTFCDNACDGAFELYWKDTLRMKGVIRRKVLCGEGTEYYPDGKVLYEGNYAKSMRDGKGRLNFPDGSFYIGNFTSGNIHGRGTFYSPKGKAVFSGSFLKNHAHTRS